MRSSPTARLLVAGVIGWSCAYYNGLYNANQLAGDATRARREGRSGEARAHWQEVALKAESVAIRFPQSKYRDDALLLQGRALFETEQCDRAILPLRVAADSGRDPAVRRRAQLLLGECHVLLGDPVRAYETLSPLVNDPDPQVARGARVWRARAALAHADYSAALEDLSRVTDTTATFDRVAAMVGIGRVTDATALLSRLAPGGYDEPGWLGALQRLGATAPELASSLVDSLLSRGNISPGQKARLLLADAARWDRAANPDRSLQRLDQAARTATDSTDGRMAQVRSIIAQVRRLRDPDRLPYLMDQLRQAIRDGGEPATLASPLLEALRKVTEQPPAAPDLARFMAIERIRDSLDARPLAAVLFRRLQRDFPRSPIAPKALLASAELEPDSAGSVAAMLDSLYPQSPYRLGLNGEGEPAFAALEDSLRRLLDSGTAKGPRPAEPTPRPSTGRQIPEP